MRGTTGSINVLVEVIALAQVPLTVCGRPQVFGKFVHVHVLQSHLYCVVCVSHVQNTSAARVPVLGIL